PPGSPPGLFDFCPEMLDRLERLDCPLADLSGFGAGLDGRWLYAPGHVDPVERLARLVEEGARACESGDPGRAGAVFAEPAPRNDRSRAFQARRRLAEAVLATPVPGPWP